jgi:hypothetical protein
MNRYFDLLAAGCLACSLVGTPALATEVKKPGPSPSDTMDPFRVAPGRLEVTPFALHADLVQGAPDSPSAQVRYVRNGTLELTQVSTNLGGMISGRFKINTTAFEEEKKP